MFEPNLTGKLLGQIKCVSFSSVRLNFQVAYIGTDLEQESDLLQKLVLDCPRFGFQVLLTHRLNADLLENR